jgi:hypothetical protein
MVLNFLIKRLKKIKMQRVQILKEMSKDIKSLDIPSVFLYSSHLKVGNELANNL